MSEIVSAGAGASKKNGSVQKRILKTAKKLFASTGKAAWIVSTTFLVLVVPLIIETDREQQLVELEQQQMGVLTATKPSS
ncbi:mitochondrial import receptor subunit TOM9 [Chloropicon roscoffensis]|uniref:Mitochondrial import receptor subunit TOM9 n=1 Tax=Chloropicon roscoffensis TaxID=1461544 RepID=A0AAX4PJD7_9CHLO